MKQNIKHIIRTALSRILTILPLLSLCLLLASCDTGGEDDGTLGNWFLAILWILVWLKGK